MSSQDKFIRYLLLSPENSMRQAFVGAVFGAFELSPQGRGEKVTFKSPSGDVLEIVGIGEFGKLYALGRKLFEGNVKIDGILALLPSGDTESLDEARSLARWLGESGAAIPMRTLVVEKKSVVSKEIAKKTLITLMNEHEEFLEASGSGS